MDTFRGSLAFLLDALHCSDCSAQLATLYRHPDGGGGSLEFEDRERFQTLAETLTAVPILWNLSIFQNQNFSTQKERNA